MSHPLMDCLERDDSGEAWTIECCDCFTADGNTADDPDGWFDKLVADGWVVAGGRAARCGKCEHKRRAVMEGGAR